MERKFTVLEFVKSGVEDDADRTRVCSAISQPTTAPIDGAGIHAGAATDALERMPEIWHSQPATSPVVHKHDVQFAAIPRASEMGGILRERSSLGTASQEAEKYTH